MPSQWNFFEIEEQANMGLGISYNKGIKQLVDAVFPNIDFVSGEKCYQVFHHKRLGAAHLPTRRN
jgi:hypothetical protein